MIANFLDFKWGKGVDNSIRTSSPEMRPLWPVLSVMFTNKQLKLPHVCSSSSSAPSMFGCLHSIIPSFFLHKERHSAQPCYANRLESRCFLLSFYPDLTPLDITSSSGTYFTPSFTSSFHRTVALRVGGLGK